MIPADAPRARTALATVTSHASGGFTLDKTIFHAPDARYHHRQPCDRGHAVVAGSKLKIHKVGWDGQGRLIHRTDSKLPPVGAKAQLHLDGERRDVQARAHTLMHLLLQALAEARAEHVGAPEVVGGGEVRAHVRLRGDAGGVAKRVDALVAARSPVESLYMTREDVARVVTPQHVPLDVVGGDAPTLRVTRIGACVLPCDAPLVEHAWQVGSVAWAATAPSRDGSVQLRARVK